MYEPQGLAGFKWLNGLPHPINSIGEFIILPEIQMTPEYTQRVFETTYELCIQRGKFLIDIAKRRNNGNENEEAEGEVEVEDEEGETGADCDQSGS